MFIRKHKRTILSKQQASNVRIRIEAPYEKLKNKMIDKGLLTIKKDKSWHINAITH